MVTKARLTKKRRLHIADARKRLLTGALDARPMEGPKRRTDKYVDGAGIVGSRFVNNHAAGHYGRTTLPVIAPEVAPVHSSGRAVGRVADLRKLFGS